MRYWMFSSAIAFVFFCALFFGGKSLMNADERRREKKKAEREKEDVVVKEDPPSKSYYVGWVMAIFSIITALAILGCFYGLKKNSKEIISEEELSKYELVIDGGSVLSPGDSSSYVTYLDEGRVTHKMRLSKTKVFYLEEEGISPYLTQVLVTKKVLFFTVEDKEWRLYLQKPMDLGIK